MSCIVKRRRRARQRPPQAMLLNWKHGHKSAPRQGALAIKFVLQAFVFTLNVRFFYTFADNRKKKMVEKFFFLEQSVFEAIIYITRCFTEQNGAFAFRSKRNVTMCTVFFSFESASSCLSYFLILQFKMCFMLLITVKSSGYKTKKYEKFLTCATLEADIFRLDRDFSAAIFRPCCQHFRLKNGIKKKIPTVEQTAFAAQHPSHILNNAEHEHIFDDVYLRAPLSQSHALHN